MSCNNFILEVLNETWYKELEDPDTFYTNVMALKALDHLTKLFSGLHTVNSVDIPKGMKPLFSNYNGVPQHINAMELAQRKFHRAKLVIHDEYLHAVALKLLLQSSEYKTETRKCSKLLEEQ